MFRCSDPWMASVTAVVPTPSPDVTSSSYLTSSLFLVRAVSLIRFQTALISSEFIVSLFFELATIPSVRGLPVGHHVWQTRDDRLHLFVVFDRNPELEEPDSLLECLNVGMLGCRNAWMFDSAPQTLTVCNAVGGAASARKRDWEN
eukprot:Selendium_serpulae@DN5989_c1_g1_i27.p2